MKRGSLTLWFDEASVAQWYTTKLTGKRGRPKAYSEVAILCMLTLKAIFKLPLRATQGLVESFIHLLRLHIVAANYTTVCRRQKSLIAPLCKKKTDESLHAVFDSTGLKVFGEGE